MAQSDDSLDLSMAASALRSNTPDLQALLNALYTELSDTLGKRLTVERSGGRLKKSSTIAALHISLGNDLYDAVVEGPVLRCRVGHFSGGIRIRSDEVDTNTWITRLLGSLQTEAAHSEKARLALEQLIIGGS